MNTPTIPCGQDRKNPTTATTTKDLENLVTARAIRGFLQDYVKKNCSTVPISPTNENSVTDPFEAALQIFCLLGLSFDGNTVKGQIPFGSSYMVHTGLALLKRFIESAMAQLKQLVETYEQLMVEASKHHAITIEGTASVAMSFATQVRSWEKEPRGALSFCQGRLDDKDFEKRALAGQVHGTVLVLDTLLLKEAVRILSSL
jgi:hypothetical protein